MLPEQCRAARAILELGQAEVARMAGVNPTTVLHFEKGLTRPHAKSLLALRTAFEAAGITFIDGQWPGVRRRKTKSPEDL